MTDFTKFSYIRPPRTEMLVPPTLLPMMEQRKWLEQIKLNGSRTLIYVGPDREPENWNRHGDKRDNKFNAGPAGDLFRDLPGSRWYVFDCEFMKTYYYLFDILVCDGEHLGGTTYQERYDLFEGVWPYTDTQVAFHSVNDHVKVARNYTKDLLLTFQALDQKEHEGVVLKRPGGIWISGSSANDWMVRCRRGRN